MLETKAVIWSVAFFVVILLLILFLWQMWRTAKNMATALEALNKTLPEILANMQEIIANINIASAMIKHETEEVVLLSQRVRAFLGMVNDLELTVLQGVRVPLVETLKTARGVLKGVGAFLSVFMRHGENRRREKERE